MHQETGWGIVKSRRWWWIAGSVALCAAVLTVTLYNVTFPTDTPPQTTKHPPIVIDAGHGEFDSGAMAPDGTNEKDINLPIAVSLARMLTAFGYDVVLTRESDSGLHSPEDTTVREKKVSDMKARLALYEQAWFNVSIHQNMFAATSCHGAQVFYSTNHPCSKVLATYVRDEVVGQLQPDNTREIKTGNRDIYLLHKTTKPTVLVECGFLSNSEELAKLKDEQYQRELAFVIACGVMRYAAEKGDIV